MNCEDAKYKCQLLIDDELNEDEIFPLIDHIESCYKCRDEYIGLLKLRKKLSGMKTSAPEEEWFETLSRKKGRRFTIGFGLVLMAVSYILLLGFALFALFTDSAEGVFIKIIVAAGLVSVIVLFVITLSDRMREGKTDKYKGIIK
ncbi:MAG: hypothetical protein JEZ04_10990 [Spirochaetales bacterium]|nr:hypothetical protein [Spirochaetales bacterium]